MGGIVSSIFGGQSQPSQPNTQVYQPSGTGSQDQNLQNLLTQSYNNVSGSSNPYSQLSPQMLQVFQQLFNPANAGGYQTSANNAGAQSTALGQQAGGASSALNSSALALLPGAMQVANMGLDPQSALYNQQLQQTNDQSNVTNAQYGLTGQQAAGNTQQADVNFNNTWQNQQLQRAIAGLGGASSAITNAGTAANTANSIGAGGAAATLAGGATPYSAGQNIGAGNNAAIMQYLSQLLGPSTSAAPVIGEGQNYLNTGVNASAQGANASLNDYYAQLQQEQQLGSGIGSLLGMGSSGGGAGLFSGLSSLFGGGGGDAAAAMLPFEFLI